MCILSPIDGGPKTPYSVLYTPSTVFWIYSPSYTRPACLLTDATAQIAEDGCDPSLHTRPESPHHLSGISSVSVLLFLPRSFPSARVFDILLSIQPIPPYQCHKGNPIVTVLQALLFSQHLHDLEL